jgi:hypothetical protein
LSSCSYYLFSSYFQGHLLLPSPPSSQHCGFELLGKYSTTSAMLLTFFAFLVSFLIGSWAFCPELFLHWDPPSYTSCVARITSEYYLVCWDGILLIFYVG